MATDGQYREVLAAAAEALTLPPATASVADQDRRAAVLLARSAFVREAMEGVLDPPWPGAVEDLLEELRTGAARAVPVDYTCAEGWR